MSFTITRTEGGMTIRATGVAAQKLFDMMANKQPPFDKIACSTSEKTRPATGKSVRVTDPADAPSGSRRAAAPKVEYPPLDSVSRPTVPTDQAAYYLDRRPQTLRGWACLGDGPIKVLRVHGRLAWSVSDIKSILGKA